MSLRSNAFSGMSWTTASSAVIVVLQVAQLILFARVLQPADFGIMGITMVIIGLAQAYSDSGISGAIVHHQEVRRQQLSSLFYVNIATGIMLFIAIQCCIPLFTFFFKQASIGPVIRVVSCNLVFISTGKIFETVLQKELRFDLLAHVEIAAAAVSFAAGTIAALCGYGVWALVILTTVGAFTRCVMLVLYTQKLFFPEIHFKKKDLHGYISFGLFQLGERTVNYLAQRLDQVIIGRVGTPYSLGLYSLAFNTMVQPVSRINPIITRVAFPLFAKVQDERHRLQKGYFSSVGVISFVNSALFCAAFVAAPYAVPVFLGDKWHESVILFQLLSAVMLLRSIGNPVGALALAKGRPDIGFYWNIGMLAINIPGLYIGVKLAGSPGAAAALLIIQILVVVPFYVLYIKKLLGACGWEYGVRSYGPIVCGAFSAALATIVGRSIKAGNLAHFFIAVGFFLFLYAGSIAIAYGRTISEFNFLFRSLLKSRTSN